VTLGSVRVKVRSESPDQGTLSRYVNSLRQFDKTYHKPANPRYHHAHHSEEHVIGVTL
jgi:hypothetical protein